MIQVVNKRNYSGPGEYIGRPQSPLGNLWSHKSSKYAILVKSRREAIDKYKDWIDAEPEDSPAKKELRRLAEIYKKTGELVLICWCSPASCHGHYISELIHNIAGI